MRTFEKILIGVLCAIYLLNLFPAGWDLGWLNFSLLNLLALMLVIHLGIEHSRWQMGPLYILTLVTLAIMFGRQANPGLLTTPWSGAAGLGLLALSSLLPVLMPVPFSPAPGGPYTVGTMIFDWTDPARPEIYSATPGTRRRIMVQAWYPAERGGMLRDPAERGGMLRDPAEHGGVRRDPAERGGPHPAGKPLPYFERPDAAGRGFARRVPSFIFRYLSLGRTHSYPEAPIARSPAAFPVLIFSHGWTGYRAQNNFQVEELASQGYVVFSADHTYGAMTTIFSDGSVVYYKPEALPAKVSDEEYDLAARRLGQAWVGDIRFVLDQAERIQSGEISTPLSGRLDLDQVGVLGHSTGGGAAVEACWLDGRFKAGLAMDAWMIPYDRQIPREGLRQPFLYMQSEKWDIPRNAPLMAALFENMQGCAYRLTIAGSHHPDFSELPLLTPLLRLTGFRGRIRPHLQMQIVNGYTLAFFDHFLKGQPAGLLEQAESPFPPVNFEGRRPHCET